MTYPAVIFWLVAVFALYSKGPTMYYLFFASWSFGTLAVVPTELLGGISLTPAWICAVLMTGKTMAQVGPAVYASDCLDHKRFGLWTLCTLYAFASAFFLPFFFAGQTDVILMRLSATTPGATALGFSTANVTQSLYFLLTSLTVINIYFAALDERKRADLMAAFIFGASIAVVTGLIDLGAAAVGATSLLEPFRNASYVLMVDDSVGSMKRVVGLMSEASSYAGVCISFLAPLALFPWRKYVGPIGMLRLPLAGMLVLCTYLSTSSGGYVSLAATFLVIGLSVAMGTFWGRRGAWLAAYGGLLLLSVALGVLVFAPTLADALWNLINQLVLTKSSSSSYIERGEWNRIAMKAFFDTHGMGVGLGSARASSWVVAVISNLGTIGASLLVLFMITLFASRARNSADRQLATEAKLAILPNILVMSLSGTSANFGSNVAWLFGLLAALSWSRVRESKSTIVLAPSIDANLSAT